MADIKLFVCCHQPVEVPRHTLLVPVQVGAVLGRDRFSGFLYDDTGDHISEKNRSYCELTAQYWAWKNIYADYYGFFHYRRYLYPRPEETLPYRIERAPTSILLDRLGYACFEELIERYDLIAPKGEDMRIPVREHYARSPAHHDSDLALVEDIIKVRKSAYIPAMRKYLSGTVCYFGNIYIMRAWLFDAYCKWLFPILAEFDRLSETTGYNAQEKRVNGFLAERLFGVFYTKVQSEGFVTLELPRVDFISETGERWKRKLIAALLPPGSKRRATVKNTISQL